eukprot:6419471-Prymnesium_polylepis.1
MTVLQLLTASGRTHVIRFSESHRTRNARRWTPTRFVRIQYAATCLVRARPSEGDIRCFT